MPIGESRERERAIGNYVNPTRICFLYVSINIQQVTIITVGIGFLIPHYIFIAF